MINEFSLVVNHFDKHCTMVQCSWGRRFKDGARIQFRLADEWSEYKINTICTLHKVHFLTNFVQNAIL